MTSPSVLIYGYGNPGRRDDGLGANFVERVENANYPGVKVDCNYQLSAEDSLLISEMDIVVFVDASTNAIEDFRLTRLEPESEVSFTTHAMSPGSVLALCHELYQKFPNTYVLEIRGYEWELEESLSDRARRNLDEAVRFLFPLLENPCREAFVLKAEM